MVLIHLFKGQASTTFAHCYLFWLLQKVVAEQRRRSFEGRAEASSKLECLLVFNHDVHN